MARTIAGDGWKMAYGNYDSGEVCLLDYSEVFRTVHDVVRRVDGAKIASIAVTWGDFNAVRFEGSGAITPGIVDLARWVVSDAADAADAAVEIVPPIG